MFPWRTSRPGCQARSGPVAEKGLRLFGLLKYHDGVRVNERGSVLDCDSAADTAFDDKTMQSRACRSVAGVGATALPRRLWARPSGIVAALAILVGGGVLSMALAADTGALAETRPSSQDSVQGTQGGDLLATVQQRGTLNCGVSGAAVAFSETQPDGRVTGFDVDYCRAVAAAVLGDADAVQYVNLTSAQRFLAVTAQEVDLLMRTTTWTQSRDTELGMDFGPTTYFDGQRFMARAGEAFTEASDVVDLDGAVVCANAGTTTEKNASDAARDAGVEITLNTYEDADIVLENFVKRACDVITADGSRLVGNKVKHQPQDQQWVIFPPTAISKEPLGPVYPQNQSRFADAVNWTVYATIIADEKGITSENVDEMAVNPPDAEADRLLGGQGELQTSMGLRADAFRQVIAKVGNYDEIYDRNLGPVGLTRAGSPNASWLDGGLIYAPPAR